MSTTKNKNQIDLLKSPVGLTLKRMTIPMTYGMILLMTFNLIDTFFVGLLGTQPLAAISFTFPITFTIISLTIGLGIGTSAVIAKYLGSNDEVSAKNVATSSILLTGILVAFIALLGFYYTDDIFILLGAEPNLLPLIHDYMDYWFLGCICLIGPMIGNAILRASGDTKTPSIIMGSAGLINAILDPMLIFGFGPIPAMGIKGAAIATLISWVFGLFLVLYLLAVKRDLIHKKIVSLSLFIQSSREVLRIGLPAAGANMLTPIAAAVLTAIVASYGESAVAAFGVGSRIESIACLVVLAMSMTLPPFISQNLGAGNMARVEEGYKTAIKFSLIWQLGIYIVLAISASFIADVFSTEKEVADLIKLYIWILPLGYGLQGVIILTNSSFNALHKPMTALVLSLLRLFVFYVPLAYAGSELYGLIGFFVGGLLGNLLMAFVSYTSFTKQFKKSPSVNLA
ncbi:MATE family efflux transporter [Thalassotalea eurytherma]|uniref:MATE family efflux transporter n=1 Tax=Thalassotalea eurytherma TaxID=1144278 RepID=A0ABQ6H753_9GAMM|nr:MATE family efflux transporter [Thalassotalea eurytherma]GLX82281.1 MATE family efflux transporter [Thalassotalea eurytherma]